MYGDRGLRKTKNTRQKRRKNTIIWSRVGGGGIRDRTGRNYWDIANEIYVVYLLMSDGIVAGCLFHHLFAVIERQSFQDILSSALLASSFCPVMLY